MASFSENSLLPTYFPGYTRPEVALNFRQKPKSLPMHSYRNLLLPMVVGVAIIVAGAMAQQTSPPSPPAEPPPAAKAPPSPKPPQADPAATKVLDEAVNAKQLDSVQTTFFEQ